MRTWRSFAFVPFLLVLAACGGGGRGAVPAGSPGAVAPAAAVERFMKMVESKDYQQMGYVFGTKEGPIIGRDPLTEVERRMYAIASILEHSSFAIRGQSSIPGRTGEAIQLLVEVEHRGQKRQVPFVVVRGPDQRWLVEQIDLEKVTRMR